jgi:hypothetical protein
MSFTEHVCANGKAGPKRSSVRPRHRKLRRRVWVNNTRRRSQWIRKNLGSIRIIGADVQANGIVFSDFWGDVDFKAEQSAAAQETAHRETVWRWDNRREGEKPSKITLATDEETNIEAVLIAHVGKHCEVAVRTPGAGGYGIHVSGTLVMEDGRFSVCVSNNGAHGVASFTAANVAETRFSLRGTLLVTLKS